MSINKLNNIEIGGYNFNYTGMVCSKTNKPHGYGRAIDTDNFWFYEGQFKNGERHGYIRGIDYNGDIEHWEFSNGEEVRSWK